MDDQIPIMTEQRGAKTEAVELKPMRRIIVITALCGAILAGSVICGQAEPVCAQDASPR